MDKEINYYGCIHRMVEPRSKRILLGVSNNNYSFQITMLPDKILSTEILYKKKDFTCCIRWHTESSRKVSAWYKNLRFESNITKKDDWFISDCRDDSIVCFMTDGGIYKDFDEYRKINPVQIDEKIVNCNKQSVNIDSSMFEQNDGLDEDCEIDEIVDACIKKNFNLYSQIRDKNKFEEELWNEISYGDIKDVSYFSGLSKFFKNFIFAEKNISHLSEYYSYEKALLLCPKLADENVEWVQKAIITSIDKMSTSVEYIYISDEFFIELIYMQLDEMQNELIQEKLKMENAKNFEVLFNNVVSSYGLDYYWNRFYGVVEQGKVINVEQDVLKDYFSQHNKLILMKADNLTEYNLFYSILSPLYEKFILTKRRKIRPIILNMDKHLKYFEMLIFNLYKNGVIKDIDGVVEVISYDNLDKVLVDLEF